MGEPTVGLLALVHCGWPRDRELLAELLGELGVEARTQGEPAEIRRLLAEDRVDLVLADSAGGPGSLADLLDAIDGRADVGELPMVLLADPQDLTSMAGLITRQFNAVLLTKPVAREQLIAAVESGLRFRRRQRQVFDLLDQLGATNAELERRRDEAAEEARRKTRFLAAISHDIRTPVNALVLSCQLLRAIGPGDPDPDLSRELTDALLSNAASLVELVNDLLDIARYDQGKLDFVESDFPLGEFLDRILDGLRPLAEQKRLELLPAVETPRAVVRTDRIKLGRVIQNLVANAIKFTEEGRIRVVARASVGSGLSLEVSDTGVGIPESMRESIFDEFAQLRNPERDRTKGTGLGLAICRRLVAAMGGEIRVATGPGRQGSTFLVTLPPSRVVDDDGRDASRGEASGEGPLGRFAGRVLVVEDHEPSRTLLRRLLGQSGLDVDVAATGREAIDRLDGPLPDLILLDLMMPEMGGLEALRIIRSRPGSEDLPVVILTGDLDSRADEELTRVGATACLKKPVDLPRLIALLEDFVPADASPRGA